MENMDEGPGSSPFVENIQSSPFIDSPGNVSKNTPLRNRGGATDNTPLGRPNLADVGLDSIDKSFRGGVPLLNQISSASPRIIVDKEDQALREQVRSLQFQLSSLKDERELEKVKYEQNVRDLEGRLKEDGKTIDKLESDKLFLFNKHKDVTEELTATKQQHLEKQEENESTIRNLREQVSQYQDTHSKIEAEHRKLQASTEQTIKELTFKASSSSSSVTDLTNELETTFQLLNAEKSRVLDLEEEQDKLKSQLAKLQTQVTDQESSEQFQSELAQQVDYIKSLEDEVSRKTTRIQFLEDNKVLVEVIEDEKAALQKKLEVTEDLRSRLVDSELQIVELQSQQDKWLSFLEKDESYSSPEEIVQALMIERTGKINLMEKVGRLEAEIAGSAPMSDGMRLQIDKLSAEIDELNDKLGKEIKSRLRYQRQKDLAASEALFLRGQLKSYDTEESVLLKKDTDSLKVDRIKELESLVDKYRAETSTLVKQLDKQDGHYVEMSPLKRKITPFSSDERVSELTRKTRNLQTELDNSRLQSDTLTKELGAVKQQLAKVEKVKATRTRILELKDNPAAKHEAVKLSMITALRNENKALLAQLENRPQEKNKKLVPYSSLEAVRAEMRELNTTIAEQSKRMDRLKQVFGKKSLEFREAVFALLGYKVDLLPNKKVRATSVYAASDEESFTFVPDPKARSIKFSGIDDCGPLTTEYENLISFWIKERRDIPCFLAALNLELYDKTTKAARF